jgi:hypothetical protein
VHQPPLPRRQFGDQSLFAPLHELAADHTGLVHDAGSQLLGDVRIVALPGGEIGSCVAWLDQGHIVTLI